MPTDVVSTRSHRRGVVAGLLGAIAAATTDVAYVMLVNSQDATGPNPGVVPFLIVYIAAIAALSLLGVALIVRERTGAAQTVLAAATAGSAALGFLAIFSIGLALIITSFLLASAALGLSPAGRATAWWARPIGGAVTAVCVLVAGFTLTGVFWGS